MIYINVISQVYQVRNLSISFLYSSGALRLARFSSTTSQTESEDVIRSAE